MIDGTGKQVTAEVLEVFFSPEQWAKIEASIRSPGLRASSKHRRAPVKVLPEELKQAICDALLMHTLMSTINYHPEAQEYQALTELVNLTRDYYLRLSELKRDLDAIELKALMEETDIVHALALTELKLRPKPTGGRPREINRDGLVNNLIDIYTRWTGWPLGLSRSADPQNPKRRNPSGPCYRFVTTILQMRGLPIDGVEHIIENAAAHTKKPSQMNRRL